MGKKIEGGTKVLPALPQLPVEQTERCEIPEDIKDLDPWRQSLWRRLKKIAQEDLQARTKRAILQALDEDSGE